LAKNVSSPRSPLPYGDLDKICSLGLQEPRDKQTDTMVLSVAISREVMLKLLKTCKIFKYFNFKKYFKLLHVAHTLHENKAHCEQLSVLMVMTTISDA